MTDHTLSSLRRRARQTGSVEDRAAVRRVELRHAPACEACDGYGMPSRVRGNGERYSTGGPACSSCAGTGSPLRARVELAAYCGDESARAALGRWLRDGWVHPDVLALESWIRGLNAWADVGRVPGWVLVRASVAAARVAYGEWAPELCDGECGTEDERDCPVTGAALRAIEAAEAWLAGPTEARWTAWHVAYVEAGHLAWLPRPSYEAAGRVQDGIRDAAALTGEQPVREAICRSLVEWALEDA